MTTVKAKPFTSPPVESEIPYAELIPANQLRRYPSNRVVAREHVEAMADSIRQIGVLQPITVRPLACPETHLNGMHTYYEIVSGESRWLGCRELDEGYPVPCFVRELSDKDAARVHTVENFQRKELDVIEEARALKHLRDTGWSVEEIMVFLGRKKEHVYQRLTLLTLEEEAQTALREGSITLGTAVKLASVPAERRGVALTALLEPKLAARALSERQAMELLDDEFIAPEKAAREWEKRRDAILENYPGAKWQGYEEAVKTAGYTMGYVRADMPPGKYLLSDAARDGQLVVPKWEELARKHGAVVVIGCDRNGEAGPYVEQAPLVDAEKVAFNDNPGECIFPHEAAVFAAREAAERHRLERKAYVEALWAEQMKVVGMILAADGIGKTATAKLVAAMGEVAEDDYLSFQALSGYWGMEDAQEVTGEVLKYLRAKTRTPWESLGRLTCASWVAGGSARETCAVLFESGAIKKEKFPTLLQEYEKWQAHQAEMAAKADEDPPEIVDVRDVMDELMVDEEEQY